jgi:hypothetical protein
MHELDQQLENLVLQAQKYPRASTRRQKILQELSDIMIPSNSKHRPPKSTDDEARRRLGGLKNGCRGIYGSKVEGDFHQDLLDVLQEAQTEVLTKIDIYKKGVDSELYKAWLKFCQTSPSQRNPEVYSELEKQVEKFRNRFLQRRTKKETKTYPPEKTQQLEQAYTKFCENLKSGEIDLQQVWNTFGDEVQQLYRPLKFWNWFARYVKFRFIDIIRDRLKEVSADTPTAKKEGDTTTQTRLDKIKAKADSRMSPQAIKLIYEDPDGIFRGKHIRNYPHVNFREIALLKFQESSLVEINQHFGNKVNAQTTISPFYTRTCDYFKPIIEEYLEAKIALPRSVIEQIVNDAEGRYNKRRMPEHSQITFKGIIEARLGGVPSWTILARQLQVNVKDLIYFYLDGISYFKLMTKPKTRTRNNKKNNPPIDE